ncbi:CRISPR-associated endonuclease Cas3'' [Candidatus Bathyarchaeota archaeon A05DMB-2]|jgi:CRISPR-associated endonuclease Cas3-HD|nr:CRISPR-associated endonuclease Cas3'' [Candidatus Bathyarchaeota archaeon A05DMB-2]
MKPYAYNDQLLFDHLKNTLNFAQQFIQQNANISCRRFKASGLNIDLHRFKFLARVAALTHDIGKGADQYQRKQNIGKEKPTFMYHELPSAIISWRLLEKVGISKEERLLVFMGVLQHHNAMRDWLQDENLLQKLNRFRQPWTFSMCIDEINKFLDEEIGYTEVLDTSLRDIFELIKYVKECLSKIRLAWPKLYCLLMAPVVIGDNLDAYKVRANDLSYAKRWFIEELKIAIGD